MWQQLGPPCDWNDFMRQSAIRVISPAILAGLVLGVLALAYYGRLLQPGVVLFSSDSNLGATAFNERTMSQSLLSRFYGAFPLLGVESTGAVLPNNLAIWMLGAGLYNNWIFAVHMVLSSVLFVAYLRRCLCGWVACLVGGMVAFWVGSNFTLSYAGHVGKFEVLAGAAAFLWLLDISVGSGRWPWVVLAGGAFGVMFPDQPDLALFVGLPLGAYAAFRYGQRFRWRPWPVFSRLAVIVVMALLVSGPALLGAYLSNVTVVEGAKNEASHDDAKSKWEFATQWSVPPDETIDLIAPNYFGIRSGEPDGPYWGRTGRSAGWEQTHQGFMNFRLESIYIGAIPITLALFAVMAALMGRGREKSESKNQKRMSEPQRSGGMGQADEAPLAAPSTLDALPADRRAEILFWGAVAAISLLMAYGKYFPLYALFYKLPVVDSIRNPNKFLQVLQLALGILAAYGLDCAVKWHRPKADCRRDALSRS